MLQLVTYQAPLKRVSSHERLSPPGFAPPLRAVEYEFSVLPDT
jgi:hypothetical protein